MNARALGVLLLLSLGGCVGTETGNPSIAAALGATSSDTMVASLDPSDNAILIEEAWLSIAEARTVDGAACDRVHGEPVLDAVAGDVVSGVRTVGLPDVEGCGLHVVFAPATELPAGAPTELAEHALVARGRRADGASFEVLARFDHAVDVVASAPRSFTADGAVVLATDVAAWFGAFDLAGRAPDADGVVRLGATDADTLELERGLSRSFELFVDADGDGALNPAELAAGSVADSHGP